MDSSEKAASSKSNVDLHQQSIQRYDVVTVCNCIYIERDRDDEGDKRVRVSESKKSKKDKKEKKEKKESKKEEKKRKKVFALTLLLRLV